MMKTILSAAMLLGTLAAQAQNTGDTLVIKQPKQVKIETQQNEQHIVISGMKDDDDFHYTQRIAINSPADVRRTFADKKDFNKVRLSKNKDKKGTVEGVAHLDVGLTAMTGAPNGYDSKVGFGEIAFNINAEYYPFGAKNSWSIGFGIDWRRYCLGTKKWLGKDAANNNYLTPQDFSSSQSDCATRLYTFSLQVPIMYTHYFDQKQEWSIGLGAIVNFNTGSHLTRTFTTAEEDFDIKTYKVGQRPVTIDLMMTVATPWFLDLYVKYSPTTYFKSDRGPKFHQLSFGVRL